MTSIHTWYIHGIPPPLSSPRYSILFHWDVTTLSRGCGRIGSWSSGSFQGCWFSKGSTDLYHCTRWSDFCSRCDNIACWCRLWCSNYWCLRCRWKCSGDIFKRWTFFRGGDLDNLVCPTLDRCCIQEKYALELHWTFGGQFFFSLDIFSLQDFYFSSAFHTLMEPGNGPLQEEIP